MRDEREFEVIAEQKHSQSTMSILRNVKNCLKFLSYFPSRHKGRPLIVFENYDLFLFGYKDKRRKVFLSSSYREKKIMNDGKRKFTPAWRQKKLCGRILRPDTKFKAGSKKMFKEDEFCVQIEVTILLIYADTGLCYSVPIFLALRLCL